MGAGHVAQIPRTEHRRARARRTAALVVYATLLAGLLPTLHLFGGWHHPVLIGALWLMAVIALQGQVRFGVAAGHFDAELALVPLALVVAGPLPTLAMLVVPDLVSRTVLRVPGFPLRSVGLLANCASYVAGIAAADWVLHSAARTGSPPLLTAMLVLPAGLAYIGVNFSVARLVHQVLWNGKRANQIAPEFLSVVPAILGTLVLAVAIARLLPLLGDAALLLVSPLVLVPQLAAALTRAQPVSERSSGRATVLYARALAAELGLSRRERRRVALAAQMIGGDGEPSGAGLHDLSEARFLAFHVTERYDGAGAPAQIPGALIPLGSRILATASAWSALTARDTAQLPHEQALLGLQLEAGAKLDPAVVTAAAELIGHEQRFAREPTAAPILHRLPAPSPVRSVVARVMGSCVLSA